MTSPNPDEGITAGGCLEWHMKAGRCLLAAVAVLALFNVSVFPTYIVLDGEGIVRFRHSGASADGERRLEDEIRKSLSAGAPRQ